MKTAKGHAQLVQQCAIGTDAVLHHAFRFVLRGEDEVVLATPALAQVFERFADGTFVMAARYAPDVCEFFEVVVDQKLAHRQHRVELWMRP